MVKNEKHRTRALINNNRTEVQLSEQLKKIITQMEKKIIFPQAKARAFDSSNKREGERAHIKGDKTSSKA